MRLLVECLESILSCLPIYCRCLSVFRQSKIIATVCAALCHVPNDEMPAIVFVEFVFAYLGQFVRWLASVCRAWKDEARSSICWMRSDYPEHFVSPWKFYVSVWSRFPRPLCECVFWQSWHVSDQVGMTLCWVCSQHLEQLVRRRKRCVSAYVCLTVFGKRICRRFWFWALWASWVTGHFVDAFLIILGSTPCLVWFIDWSSSLLLLGGNSHDL